MKNDGSNSTGLTAEQNREISVLIPSDKISSDALALLTDMVEYPDSERCEVMLNQINDQLIASALESATNTELNLRLMSLTRISPALISFLETNKESLTKIDLSGNQLSTLKPIYTLSLPKLDSLNLAANPLSQQEIDKVRALFPHLKEKKSFIKKLFGK